MVASGKLIPYNTTEETHVCCEVSTPLVVKKKEEECTTNYCLVVLRGIFFFFYFTTLSCAYDT